MAAVLLSEAALIHTGYCNVVVLQPPLFCEPTENVLEEQEILGKFYSTAIYPVS